MRMYEKTVPINELIRAIIKVAINASTKDISSLFAFLKSIPPQIRKNSETKRKTKMSENEASEEGETK
jgi:hypothetical protein